MSERQPPDESFKLVYDNLGEQVENIEEALGYLEERNLDDTEGYEKLEQRAAHFRYIRGYLQEQAGGNLRNREPVEVTDL